LRLGRPILIWASLAIMVVVPVVAAGMSPLLAWRDPVYIAAGFAGVAAMVFLLFQPLLAAGYLPGLDGRRMHRWVGSALVLAVVIHVAGLWITSPPDVVDALLFASPTPFSVWGVIAMWAMFASAILALLRRRLRLRPRVWLIGHMSLALLIVGGSVLHAMLIDGTMEWISKVLLCLLTLAAALKVISDRRKRMWRQR